MHDSHTFSVILGQSLILSYSIEYGDGGIKRAAKRREKKTEARKRKKVDQQRATGSPQPSYLRHGEALRHNEGSLRRSKPETLKSKASGPPL